MTRDDMTNEWKQVEKGIIHATDDNGEFKLKYGYKAVFDEIAAYTPEDDNVQIKKYDFDNYTIIEKSVPYWLGIKQLEVENLNYKEDGRDLQIDNGLKKITVENFYRPVVYITKNTKGVPEGTTVDKTFKYKLRIYKFTDPKLGDVERNKRQLTYGELTNGDYTILNKTIEDNQNAYTDVREDGKLYWYKVDGSAGLYECPPGWNQNNDQENLYRNAENEILSSTVKGDNDDAYFEITFNTDITNTVALPIYIKHLTNGKDDGMLYQEDDVTYPRYIFSITEVNDNGSDWFCDNVKYGGTFGMGENAFEWTNTYKYKELLLTKNITHAPDSDTLANTSFTFELTKDGNPYYYYKGDPTATPSTASLVEWTLCTMDSDGNITPKTGGETNGTVRPDGTFTVKGCGNDADKSGDKIVIKLSYVSLGENGSAAKYTITEILPERESNTDENTATTTEYLAVKESDTVQVKQNMPYSNLTIENDYLKRDITVKKVVASQTSPRDKKFEMVLCPEGKTLTEGNHFELSDGETKTFEEIGVVGDKFELYEKYDERFGLLTQEDPNDTEQYRKVTTITLGSDDDFSIDVVNGTEGYIVLRKKYIGDTTEFRNELQTANPVTFDLKLKVMCQKG